MNIDLKNYAPIIGLEEKGAEILNMIKNALSTGEVTIDFAGVKTMATFCAKQIFGSLYKDMGPDSFYEQIKIVNASEDIKSTIRAGIVSAING